MISPLVSIIIPCFNHGIYLEEAIRSVQSHCNHEYEIIIVNDGSNDPSTIEVLGKLDHKFLKIINQHNQGLAAARNNGIVASSGRYIIPLDADNILTDGYFNKAIPYMEMHEKVSVVYGNPEFFESETGLRVVGAFDFTKLVHGNFIDACAVYRKEVWEKNRGYDGQMPAMGHEDWEFWIHAYLNGSEFYYLNERCFLYRSRVDSMAKTISTPSGDSNRIYIHKKHSDKIIYALLALVIDGRYQLEVVRKYLKEQKLKSVAKILLNRDF